MALPDSTQCPFSERLFMTTKSKLLARISIRALLQSLVPVVLFAAIYPPEWNLLGSQDTVGSSASSLNTQHRACACVGFQTLLDNKCHEWEEAHVFTSKWRKSTSELASPICPRTAHNYRRHAASPAQVRPHLSVGTGSFVTLAAWWSSSVPQASRMMASPPCPWDRNSGFVQ